jgi:hypothetical protein
MHFFWGGGSSDPFCLSSLALHLFFIVFGWLTQKYLQKHVYLTQQMRVVQVSNAARPQLGQLSLTLKKLSPFESRFSSEFVSLCSREWQCCADQKKRCSILFMQQV